MPVLESIEIKPEKKPRASVIWLHGLGADGHDFEPIVPHLKIPAHLSVRFVFPHAPKIPVTVNNGFIMRAWYDIVEQSIDRKVDTKGIAKSCSMIDEMIDREIANGIPPSRIILAGFSQGGLIALQTGLYRAPGLAGIIALSTYLADYDQIPPGRTDIFMGHGSMDPVVPIDLGKRAQDALNAKGHSVCWKSYPMEHSVCMEEITEIGLWISERLVDIDLD